MTQKILVVDDEDRIVHVIQAYLERENFTVIVAHDGETALAKIDAEQPDLIVLDLMLPEISGEEICEYVRESMDIPIVMLTAKVDEEQRVSGLELGADDYVTKPFSPRELVARIKAVLRRTTDGGTNQLESRDGSIKINKDKREVIVNGAPLALTPTEYKLLLMLLKNPSKVFSRGELAEKVFGLDYAGYEETIYVHIKNLRHKIEEHADSSYIRTVYGAGYRWDENHAK